MKLAPPFVDRQMPPVDVPIRTICELDGDNAIELTLPLVGPQESYQAETVGDGPI